MTALELLALQRVDHLLAAVLDRGATKGIAYGGLAEIVRDHWPVIQDLIRREGGLAEPIDVDRLPVAIRARVVPPSPPERSVARRWLERLLWQGRN